MVRKVAYVVYHGRKPGIYFTWEECRVQIDGVPGARQKGFSSLKEAEAEWQAHQNPPTSSSNAGQSHRGGYSEHYHAPVHYIDPSRHNPIYPEPSNTKIKKKFETPSQDPSLKRSVIDLTGDSEDEQDFDTKRPKPEIYSYPHPVMNPFQATFDANPHGYGIEPLVDRDFEPVDLTEEQNSVAVMALARKNMFLTGAAGSGKTVTLKEILRRFKEQGRRYQVVAPTGMAALPLFGKTTFSFAGLNPDSLQVPLLDLRKAMRKGTVTAMKALDCLVIEEISMVENQFLERLNILMQEARESMMPFGGVQVFFLGDFHQLPPVKPFAFCLQCGGRMQEAEPIKCHDQKCPDHRRAVEFMLSDKWAFRAPVWSKLKMNHVRLEQIHRQKDTRFQDMLNKVRDGVLLTDDEWSDLTRRKELAPRAFAVRLMSRLIQVRSFNNSKLAEIKLPARSWIAENACRKDKRLEMDAYDNPRIEAKKQEYLRSLENHRFQPDLTLKVGAKVVLLANINPDGGLVNGTQGEIVSFVDAREWPAIELTGNHKEWRQELINQFEAKNSIRPIVRFANGATKAIQCVAASELRGDYTDRFVVCRTQIPLALAWALSIHKSQGMTLKYVDVTSNDIFESGQLYVALSRATALEGLTVSGFNRTQLPMDKDVLRFYQETQWERLKRSKS